MSVDRLKATAVYSSSIGFLNKIVNQNPTTTTTDNANNQLQVVSSNSPISSNETVSLSYLKTTHYGRRVRFPERFVGYHRYWTASPSSSPITTDLSIWPGDSAPVITHTLASYNGRLTTAACSHICDIIPWRPWSERSTVKAPSWLSLCSYFLDRLGFWN